ncbi:hypothetical protein TSAR_014489, partial [Trichomalopsis sarcophagae]
IQNESRYLTVHIAPITIVIMKVLATILLACFGVVIDAQPRIINGSEASISVFPFMASLRSFGEHFCDGTIISNRWILTAARCLIEHPVVEWIEVYVGNTRLSAGNEGEIYKPTRIVYHEKYDEEKGINDIGLLYLNKDIVFTGKKSFIPLSSRTYEPVIAAYIIGWGSTEPKGNPSYDLQRIVVQIVHQKTCKLAWKDNPITDSQICIMSRPGTGTCYGDLGSPLIVEGKQVGIASYAHSCATGKPEIFTRVVAHRDWIVNKTGIKNWAP